MRSALSASSSAKNAPGLDTGGPPATPCGHGGNGGRRAWPEAAIYVARTAPDFHSLVSRECTTPGFSESHLFLTFGAFVRPIVGRLRREIMDARRAKVLVARPARGQADSTTAHARAYAECANPHAISAAAPRRRPELRCCQRGHTHRRPFLACALITRHACALITHGS